MGLFQQQSQTLLDVLAVMVWGHVLGAGKSAGRGLTVGGTHMFGWDAAEGGEVKQQGSVWMEGVSKLMLPQLRFVWVRMAAASSTVVHMQQQVDTKVALAGGVCGSLAC
jgi:hypothetical protein